VPVAKATGKAASVKAPGRQVSDVVEMVAKQHSVDPLLVHSVIRAESNYNPFAVSPKGAQGMMQLMPATAKRFGVSNAFDYGENVEGGVRYLRYLMDMFKDETLAVAAYNAGEQAVIRYGGVPPYRETIDYVRSVTDAYSSAKQAVSRQETVANALAGKSVPEYPEIERYFDAQGNLCLRTR
jgi:soluble lytic murein transglycosylase-like protein